MNTPNCNRCNVPMKKRMALQNTLTGMSDFPGDEGCTVSRNGPPEMVDVWKCPKCGHSISRRSSLKNACVEMCK